VRWWEARRLHFNVYIGVVGIITWFLVLIAGSSAVKPSEDFEEPLAMINGTIMYGLHCECLLHARLDCGYPIVSEPSANWPL
jgi:hypothetical protein